MPIYPDSTNFFTLIGVGFIKLKFLSLQVLGVDKNANQRDIKKAFHKYGIVVKHYVLFFCTSNKFPQLIYSKTISGSLCSIILTRTKPRGRKRSLQR